MFGVCYVVLGLGFRCRVCGFLCVGYWLGLGGGLGRCW